MPLRLKVHDAFLACAGLVLSLGLHASIAHAAETRHAEYFEKQVRPLLVRHCYECHSENAKVKGGFKLDSRAAWMTGGDSGPAINIEDPDGSLLVKAVRYDDPDLKMPPKQRLPDEQVAVLEAWVRMGAPDTRGTEEIKPTPRPGHTIDLDAGRRHWAFQPLTDPPAPPVTNAHWPRGEIDRHVLAALEAKAWAPGPDATPRTLIRRLAFDLTGLPPSVEDVEAYASNPSPEALAALVDRWLDTPAFGETFGRHWLDVARYADSNGGDFNATFHDAWRYRDYVIEAYRLDKPFDHFILEQLAGDLLPADHPTPRREALIATGFLAMGGKMLSERDKLKLTLDVADEQIDTVGKAFLGLTLGCARCHDHKFDPIPTSDYYALAGIFTSTRLLQGEIQQYVSNWARVPLPPTPAEEQALSEHRAARTQWTQKIDAQTALLQSLRKAASPAEPSAGVQPARPDKAIRQPSELAGVAVDDDQATLTGEWKTSNRTPRYVGTGYRHNAKAEPGLKQARFTPDLPAAGDYEVRLSYDGGPTRDAKVPVIIRHARGEARIFLDQTANPPIEGLFHSLGKFTFEKGKAGSVTVETQGATQFVLIDAVQFIPTPATPPPAPAQAHSTPTKPALQSAAADTPPTQAPDLAAQFKDAEAKLKELQNKLKQFDATAPKPPTALGVTDAPACADRAICIRGEPRNLGPIVPRGFLSVLSNRPASLAKPEHSGRLELARWIASPEHPLTARVYVNRIWSKLIGEGLVRIVLSRTYALASTLRTDTSTQDPDNRLLSRAHRRPLTAEALRDGMLALAGRLDASRGGPVVSHLGALINDNSANAQRSDLSLDKNLRRSLYLPLIRTQTPDFLTAFDFADPEMVTGKRNTTNVPAQALLLLNSDFVRENAAAIAQRLLTQRPHSEPTTDDAARLDHLYRLALARPASPHERDRALAALRAEGLGRGPDADRRAWAHLTHALLASSAFRMLD